MKKRKITPWAKVKVGDSVSLLEDVITNKNGAVRYKIEKGAIGTVEEIEYRGLCQYPNISVNFPIANSHSILIRLHETKIKKVPKPKVLSTSPLNSVAGS
jgi:hypothetical protein